MEARAESLLASLAALARADLWLARARLAAQMDAVRPAITDDAASCSAPPAAGAGAVPIDLRLGERFGYRALVVTGPNTGGKTVSLKTLGLLALMHQAGCRCPPPTGRGCRPSAASWPISATSRASPSRCPPSPATCATWSASWRPRGGHAGAAGRDRGTDPTEGSALAMAVVERLLQQGAWVAATTHYAELKTFAQEHPLVSNASVAFDVATLKPTYRLEIGLPGKSQAFAIAERLACRSRSWMMPAHGWRPST